MNRIKTPEVKKPAKKAEAPAFTSARKYLKLLDNISLSGDKMTSIIPYTLFLTVIALVYIANSYYSEKTVRDIDRITKELKTLRSEYISDKSELMFYSKQSEVAKAVEPMGIKESTEAPRKIVVITQPTEKDKN
jgi:hypothetical protein